MKTKTIIEELTQEDLVNLLCTATYGSSWLEIYATDKSLITKEDGDCLEDIWAKVLLAGGKINCVDHYAEGEVYGTLEHDIDEEENVTYHVSLQDIKDGLQKCADGTSRDADKYADKGFLARCYNDFVNDGDNWDYVEADALMQVILFGELIYG